MTLGERLLQLRKDNGLSQESLGKMLYVTRQSISLWENDKAMPSIDLLKRLSAIYNISVDDLLGTEPIEPKPIAKAELVNSKNEIKQIFKFERSTSQTVLFTVMVGLLFVLNAMAMDINSTVISVIYALPLFIVWLVRKCKIYGNIKHYLSQNNNGYVLFYAHHLSIVTDIEKPPVSIAYTSFKKTVETDEYLLFYLPNESAYCVDKNTSEGYIDGVINILSKNKTHKNKSVRKVESKKGCTKKLLFLKNISIMLFVLTFFSIYFGFVFMGLTQNNNGFSFSMVIPFIALVYGVILKIKKFRGKKLIIASSIMLFFTIIYSLLFSLTIPTGPANTQNIIPVQEQYLNSYSAVFRNNGYTVIEHEELPEFKGVTDFRTATSSDGSFIVEFYAFETYFYSKSYYKNIYEKLDGNGYEENSYEQGTTAMRSVTTSEDYFYIYVNNLVAIKVHTDVENKEEIQKMLQKIGAEY